MSLLKFIERPDVREVLDSLIPKAPRKLALNTVVPSVAPDPSLIGAAFDYALRFELSRLRPDVRQVALVAERAGYREPSVASVSTERVTNARAALDRYFTLAEPSGVDKEEVATHCLLLAQLDIVSRSGKTEHLSLRPVLEQAREVVALVDAVPESLRGANRLVLNPKFGEGSFLVRGADADLIADDMIIDLKTTREPAVKKEMIRQVIGYFILARVGAIDGIHRVAIYLSRQAHLWVLPGSLEENPNFAAAEEAFLRIARANAPRRTPLT